MPIVNLIDAAHQQKMTPRTFWRPTKSRLNQLKVGELVMVCDGKERFWVKLVGISKRSMRGVIDNDLSSGQSYGFGDGLVLEKRHVYNVVTESQMELMIERRNGVDFVVQACDCCNGPCFP